MKVYVNHIPVYVLPGMTVRHALIRAELLKEVEVLQRKKVYDEWGNELGLEGELSEGIKIYFK